MQGADVWSNEKLQQGWWSAGISVKCERLACAFASLRLEDLTATGEW